MTALVIASDDLSATRAATELRLGAWTTPFGMDYTQGDVSLVVWVDGWRWSTDPVRVIAYEATRSHGARELFYQFDGVASELTNARRAGERLDVLRGIRAYRRRLAVLPPTLSPEAMASAAAATPERAPWWRRLFRKATR